MNRPSIIIPLVFLVVILATTGQTFLKNAVNGLPSDSSLMEMLVWLTGTGVFYVGTAFAGFGFITWLFVLTRADLSYATPFLAMAFPMLLLSSIFVLHEPISMLRVAGTLVVAIGMVMVAIS